MRNSNYPTRSPLHLRRDTKAAVASFVIRQGGRNKRHARGPHLSFLSASEESPVLTVLSIRMHFGHVYPCSTPTGAHIKAVDRALLHAANVGCCIAGPPADATALTCANIPTAYPLLGSPISSAAPPFPPRHLPPRSPNRATMSLSDARQTGRSSSGFFFFFFRALSRSNFPLYSCLLLNSDAAQCTAPRLPRPAALSVCLPVCGEVLCHTDSRRKEEEKKKQLLLQ